MIRAWLQANPGMARAIMDRNRSYVFFRENHELGPDDGPLGAHAQRRHGEAVGQAEQRRAPKAAPARPSPTSSGSSFKGASSSPGVSPG